MYLFTDMYASSYTLIMVFVKNHMFCNFRTPTAVDGESLASLTDQSESESEEVRSNGCYIYDIKNYIQDYWKIRTHYLYKLFAIISITSLLSHFFQTCSKKCTMIIYKTHIS